MEEHFGLIGISIGDHIVFAETGQEFVVTSGEGAPGNGGELISPVPFDGVNYSIRVITRRLLEERWTDDVDVWALWKYRRYTLRELFELRKDLPLQPFNPFRGFSRIPASDLVHWEPILGEWMSLVERISRMRGGGWSLFGFGERVNVGTLAGAAWRCGYAAMTEFIHDKAVGDDVQRGRADLEILYTIKPLWILADEGPAQRSDDLVEAKFGWLSLEDADFQAKAAKLLDDAVRDAGATGRARKPGSFQRSIGVAFVATHVSPLEPADRNRLIQAAVESVLGIEAPIRAWCFPDEERQVKADGGNYTPGVILLGRPVQMD